MLNQAAGVKRLISIKNLILMAVILVVILAAVFAWYTNNTTVTASESVISAKAADNVEFALPQYVNGVESFPINNADWSTELNFADSGFLKDLVKDVTSNGQQFVVPNFEASTGLKKGRTVSTDDVWTEGLSSKVALTNNQANDDDQYNYISLDFYVRSKLSDINIIGDSFLAAKSEVEDTPKPLVGTDIYRGSSYGAAQGTSYAFSSDAVVGAMRVSLVGGSVNGVTTNSTTHVTKETTFSDDEVSWDSLMTANGSLKFLWLPRPDIYLETQDRSDDWRLYTGIKPENNSGRNSGTVEAKTAAEIDAMADLSYFHTFYKGETVTVIRDEKSVSVNKGLTLTKYCDEEVKTAVDATNESWFYVSKSNLGTTGAIPSLGQTAPVGRCSSDSSSTSIEFTAAQDDDRETSGYYVYRFRLNIWIEGEDAEARRSMNSGAFSLELDFGN